MHRRTIFCERDFLSKSAPFYDSITIDNNNFTSIEPNWADDSIGGTIGIYLKNFNVTRSGDLPKTITVSNDMFTDTANWGKIFTITRADTVYSVNQDQYSAAILFQNTTGNIIADTIEDPAYFYGILLSGTLEKAQRDVFPTNTFLCSDLLSHLHPPAWYFALDHVFWYDQFALYTSYYDGYVKLTTIRDCFKPYTSIGDGHSNLVFDTLDNRIPEDTIFNRYSLYPTIAVSANTFNVVDLSGIHGGGNDVAAFNTLRSYRGTMMQMGGTGSLVNLANSRSIRGETPSVIMARIIFYLIRSRPTSIRHTL